MAARSCSPIYCVLVFAFVCYILRSLLYVALYRSRHSRIRSIYKRSVMPRVFVCCVPGCFNTVGGNPYITFMSFPTPPERRRQWINCLGLTGVRVARSTRVCSAHFTPDDFHGSGYLKRNAAPSLTFGDMGKSSQHCAASLRNNYSPDIQTPKTEIKEEIEVDEDQWKLQPQPIKEELTDDVEWVSDSSEQVKMEPKEEEEELEPVASVTIPSITEDLFEEEY